MFPTTHLEADMTPKSVKYLYSETKTQQTIFPIVQNRKQEVSWPPGVLLSLLCVWRLEDHSPDNADFTPSARLHLTRRIIDVHYIL